MNKDRGLVRAWLISICIIVLLILLVGGVTRLTRSGLSMVDWKPIMGVIPPLTEADWQATFSKYKQFPEYLKINYDMSLSEFKGIFFWEYFHRILGRFIGLVFIVPWVIFVIRKKLSPSLIKKTFVGFFLGGAQGLLGWYMVKSGLVDLPHVSHYRLAAHFGLAVLLFCYFLWLFLSTGAPLKTVSRQSPSVPKEKIKKWAYGLCALTSVQLIYGAFVAGLKAGLSFNTFPHMNGQVIPSSAFSLSPLWLNLFNNSAMIQFIHRSLAWVLVFYVCITIYKVFANTALVPLRRWATILGIMITIQFLLGVATLLLKVPVTIASAHQIFGVLFLGMAVIFTHKCQANNSF